MIITKTNIDGGKEIKRHFSKLLQKKAMHVQVGWFEHARHPSGIPLAAVAFYNEFGTQRDGQEHIPERPFVRNAVRTSLPKIRALKEKRDAYIGDEQQFLSAIGMTVAAEMQESAIKLLEPPNAPSTIKSKGSSNPLIDTGAMVNAISFVVRRGPAGEVDWSPGYLAFDRRWRSIGRKVSWARSRYHDLRRSYRYFQNLSAELGHGWDSKTVAERSYHVGAVIGREITDAVYRGARGRILEKARREQRKLMDRTLIRGQAELLKLDYRGKTE